MQFQYSKESDVLYVALAPGKGQVTTTRPPELNGVGLDIDNQGRLVGVEVLQASAKYGHTELQQLTGPVRWLTLTEAVAVASREWHPITATTLRAQLAKGKIEGAEKRGPDWFVPAHALLNYIESVRGSGRPSSHIRRFTVDGVLWKARVERGVAVGMGPGIPRAAEQGIHFYSTEGGSRIFAMSADKSPDQETFAYTTTEAQLRKWLKKSEPR